MGIYLLLMAAVDMHYRGDYARHDAAWKLSGLCTVAGFLSTFSGELSVLTLCAITVERYIVIGINSPLVVISRRQVKAMVLIIWLFVLTICLVPCFDGSYFKNYYGQSEMCLPIPRSPQIGKQAFTITQTEWGMKLKKKKYTSFGNILPNQSFSLSQMGGNFLCLSLLVSMERLSWPYLHCTCGCFKQSEEHRELQGLRQWRLTCLWHERWL